MAQSAQIKSMSGAHDAVLDIMLANPFLSLKDLAKATGYTPTWLSIMKRSDCFIARYNERRGDIECGVMEDVQQRLNSLVLLSIDNMEELLAKTNDPDTQVDAFDKVMKAAGYAPNSKRVEPLTVTQNNFYLSQDELRELKGNIIDGSVSTPAVLPAPAPDESGE